MSTTAARRALRASLPLVLPTAAVGVSFGLLAAPVLGPGWAVAMSALVWSGTGQFGALSALSAGGGVPLAAATGLLANARFLPMGFAIAPSLRSGPASRLGTAALLADASFVIAHRADGSFDVTALRWAMPAQYLAWVGGTAAGVLGAGALGDPAALGLDVLFPVFYLALLLPELRGDDGRWRGRPLLVAGLAGAVAVATTPLLPPGVPVLLAAAAALLGLLPDGADVR